MKQLPTVRASMLTLYCSAALVSTVTHQARLVPFNKVTFLLTAPSTTLCLLLTGSLSPLLQFILLALLYGLHLPVHILNCCNDPTMPSSAVLHLLKTVEIQLTLLQVTYNHVCQSNASANNQLIAWLQLACTQAGTWECGSLPTHAPNISGFSHKYHFHSLQISHCSQLLCSSSHPTLSLPG